MIRFSANLGFLWTELPLLQAIETATKAGFSAVECHWPYETPANEVLSQLQSCGLPMVGINTRRGNVDKGDNGVAAIIGRENEAREYIDQAIDYAADIACANVHVMAGITDQSSTAEATYQENLRYACKRAEKLNINILIEPLNTYDAPGYHLNNLDDAVKTLHAVAHDNLKIMFDCYHVQIMQGDVSRRFEKHQSKIGHVQIAAVPDRSEPDNGELHYPNLLPKLTELGWSGYIGAEYRPRKTTDEGLSWLEAHA